MRRKELKKVAKRIRREVLSKRPFKELFEGLLAIDAKINAIYEKDFKNIDISAMIPTSCTATEIIYIRNAITKKLKKEFGKKHSYFVTTKIMLALWALSEEIKETDLCSKREQFCYRYIENYDTIAVEFEEALRHIRLLD